MPIKFSKQSLNSNVIILSNFIKQFINQNILIETSYTIMNLLEISNALYNELDSSTFY